ncbi:hypothetical protein BD309DRAFT_820383, partial [Dichomitus squalens]
MPTSGVMTHNEPGLHQFWCACLQEAKPVSKGEPQPCTAATCDSVCVQVLAEDKRLTSRCGHQEE